MKSPKISSDCINLWGQVWPFKTQRLELKSEHKLEAFKTKEGCPRSNPYITLLPKFAVPATLPHLPALTQNDEVLVIMYLLFAVALQDVAFSADDETRIRVATESPGATLNAPWASLLAACFA